MSGQGSLTFPAAGYGPVNPIRLVRRLSALFAVATSASFDFTRDADILDSNERWIRDLGIFPEFEPIEVESFEESVPMQWQKFAAAWRFEGAAVLAWACGLSERPLLFERTHPEQVRAAIDWPDAAEFSPDTNSRRLSRRVS